MELSLSRIGRRHNIIYNHFWLIHVARQRDWSENFWFTLQLYDLHFLSSLFNPDTCLLFWSIGSDDVKFVYEAKKKKKGKKSWILFIELGSFLDVSFQYEREEWAAFNPDLDTVTSFWGGPGETHCDQSGRLRILFYAVVWVILWQSWGLRLEPLYKKARHCLLTWSISTTWPCALHNKKHL